MSEPSKEIPIGVVEIIKRLEQEQMNRGELIYSPHATFYFPYLNSPIFLNSPNKDGINQLDIGNVTVTTAEAAIIELGIKQNVRITTLIPEGEEKKLIIPSLAIGGRAISKAEVRLYLDPNHPKVIGALQTWKARQVAHELNHVARYQANKISHTLLGAIISEGLATYYEEHWDGQFLATPWGHSLSTEEEAREWEKAKPELRRMDYDRPAWFFGKNPHHPAWTGYSLGRAIINEYFKRHPKDSMAKVVKKSSEDILKDSRFNPSV